MSTDKTSEPSSPCTGQAAPSPNSASNCPAPPSRPSAPTKTPSRWCAASRATTPIPPSPTSSTAKADAATGQRFAATIVQRLRHHWGIPATNPSHQPDGALVTITDTGKALGVVASWWQRLIDVRLGRGEVVVALGDEGRLVETCGSIPAERTA